MDKLSELPEKEDTVPSELEEKIIEKYFDPQEENHDKKKSILYLVFYTTLLFIALSNPLTENMSHFIPFLQNQITWYMLRIAIFAICFFVIYKYT